MGNYGNTLELWYHRAAVVLWPKKHSFSSIYGASANYVVRLMESDLKKAGKKDTHQLAILWENRFGLNLKSDKAFKSALKLAKELESSSVAKKILNKFCITNFKSSFVPAFLSLYEVYGESWCLSLLKSWHKEVSPDRVLGSNNGYMSTLIKESLRNKEAYLPLAQCALTKNIQALIKEKKAPEGNPLRKSKAYEKGEVKTIYSILKSCHEVADREPTVR